MKVILTILLSSFIGIVFLQNSKKEHKTITEENSSKISAESLIIKNKNPIEYMGRQVEDSTLQYSLPNTETRYISSNINNIDYKLYISYPESYNADLTKNYPVLYLLDADYSFAIAKNITDHLSKRNHLSEIILVGIAYADPDYRINRTRDYTPVNSKEDVSFTEIQEEYSGGGPSFLSFIESELIPFVDKEYRTTNFKVVTGHSYGGLFLSWTLLTNPNLFNGYIIVSPSLWYNDKMMFRIKDSLNQIEKTTRVYFTVGDREINNKWNMPEDLKHFVKDINSKDMQKLDIKLEIGQNETHNSIFPSACSNGLRFVFDGI